MIINRDSYLQKLIDRKNNGLIKVITGIRRSGKSFLLFNLFKTHLLESGVSSEHIIELNFDMFDKKIYIQSAYSLEDKEKYYQEIRPLLNVADGFKKVIITFDAGIKHYTEEGILILSIFDFLLDDNALDY